MCLTEKCGSKSPSIIFGNFIVSVPELLALLAHRVGKFLQRQARVVHQRQRFRRRLHGRRRDHVGRELDRRRLADLADLDDLLAARFEHRPRAPIGRVIAADVVNKLAFFRRHLAAGKWRIEELRAAPMHDLRRRSHRVRRDRAVRHDHMMRVQRLLHLLHHLEQRVVIRDEDLDEIAELARSPPASRQNSEKAAASDSRRKRGSRGAGDSPPPAAR